MGTNEMNIVQEKLDVEVCVDDGVLCMLVVDCVFISEIFVMNVGVRFLTRWIFAHRCAYF